jgi:flagellar motor switch protein FliM
MTDVLSQDEIDALLTAISDGDAGVEEVGGKSGGGGTDFKERSPDRKVKIYDFKRPDKFSKDHIRTVTNMHEQFARFATTSLSAQLRTLVHLHVASVDQLTYEEFVRSIPSPTTMGIIAMDPLKGQAVLEIDPSITFTIIDRIFGGRGEVMKMNRELTDVELQVMETIMVKMLANLREAWANVIDLRPRIVTIELNPNFTSVVAPSEMVVLVTLETKVSDVEGMVNFCVPYITIEPIVTKLSAQYWYSTVKRGYTRENFNTIKERLGSIAVDVIAQLGSVEVSVKDVIDLQVGDTIKLYNSKISEDILLKVGNKSKFFCRPGVIGKRMAVQIKKQIEEVKEDIFDEVAEGGEDE